MWIYLGFLVVILITMEEKHIRQDISSTNERVKYKNSMNNEIEVNSFCESRNCVLRCCPDNMDLNSDGTCEKSSLITNKHLIHVYKWGKKPRESQITTNTLVYKALTKDDPIADFYILKHGYLKIKLKNNTEQWLGAAPLDFCVNSHLAALMNKDNLTFIFKYTEEIKGEVETDHTFKYIVAGMFVSLLIIGFIFYKMSPVLRRIFSLGHIALIFTLMAAYITTSVQVLALRARIVSSTDCRIISPFVYFFVLSIFFWLNVRSFNSWRMIRNLRKYSIKINKEVDSAKFKRFCIFGWVIPFIMMVVAIFVDIPRLDMGPSFDRCLTNDMRFYMYIPITVLTATKGLMYLMYLYDITRLQHSFDDIMDVYKFMISKYRYAVHMRLYLIISVSGLLQLVPSVPRIIYYTINSYNILVGVTMYAMFQYERCTYDVPITWYNHCEKLEEAYRKLTGAATVRSTVSTVVAGNRNSHALEGRINTSEDVENNRF